MTRFAVGGGGSAGEANNRATLGIVGLAELLKRDFRPLFLKHYDSVRATCSSIEDPGVVSVAIDLRSQKLAGIMWAAVKPGQPNSAIIGRHSATDLCLPDDPSLSLRHLALVVEPLADNDRRHLEVSYRVLDLRTRDGFYDEHDRQMRGMRVEGPAFIRVGNYAVFFLVTGDPTDWPQKGRDAWDFMPERVYLDEKLGEGTGSHGYRDNVPEQQREVLLSSGVPAFCRRTFIQSTIGPRWVENDLIEAGELTKGGLQIRTARDCTVLRFGESAARDGILLGRYERCDRAGVLCDGRISRVHMLILAVGNDLWAIDVASSCGTWQRREDGHLKRARISRLDGSSRLILADRVAEVRWV